MEQLLGRIGELWRYPVKSMLGEPLARVTVDQRGLAGDRQWAVRNEVGKFGSGKTTRRFQHMPGLFAFRARFDAGVPVIAMPDGVVHRGNDDAIHHALSRWFGFPVTLVKEAAVSHFDEGPVSLITSSSLAQASQHFGASLDARRFRANILIETDSAGYVEDEWVGRVLALGPVVRLAVAAPLNRCVMVNNAQDDLPEESGILRALAQHHGATFGVWGQVNVPGDVAVGDHVVLL